MFSLPGVLRRTTPRQHATALAERPFARAPSKERATPLPAPMSIDPRPRSVCIIGSANGMGLARDRECLGTAFVAAGWEVSFADPRDQDVPAPHAVNVHLEVVAQRFLGSALTEIIVPNPEWWVPDWNPLLSRPSVSVWAKTQDAARLFRELGARVEYIGFRSADRRGPPGHRQRTFLHVGGKSPNKGSAMLAANWRGEWPRLIIVSSQPLRTSLGNVAILRKCLPDEEVARLQNESLFHIYPSHYEGFGHAQWEGLSCEAIVFATDGAPFSEQPQAFQLLSAKPLKRGAVGAVRRHDVLPSAIASAVKWVSNLTDAEVKQQGEAARQAWEHNTSDFEARIAAAISQLELPEKKLPAPRAATACDPKDLPAFAYVGRVNCLTGQGSAARHQLHVLRRHGLRFQIVDAGSCASPDFHRRDPFVQAAITSDADSAAPGGTIIHLQPNTAEPFHRLSSLPRPHILVSVWETNKLPSDWVSLVNSYDQVWCATEWQREVYRESGVRDDLLRFVPFALDPALYRSQAPAAGAQETVFGSVFQWSERKDPGALIGAYLQAFSARDPVRLVLKSYAGDEPTTSVAARVAEIVASYPQRHQLPKIEVVSRAADSFTMTQFYQAVDCYVSAHRGEGFGFPIAEALLSGKPVIATGWSAPAEYAAGCFRAVAYTLEPARGMEDWQPFYTRDQRWARCDVIDLALAMREAHERRIPDTSAVIRDRFEGLCALAGASAREALSELVP